MTKKDDAKSAYFRSQEFLDNKAASSGDIKHFLKSFFMFRAYIKYRNGKVVHLYGNEHQVTLQQLVHNRVPSIIMDREKGYTELVTHLERKIKEFSVGAIYQRHPEKKDFSIICRRYYNGQLEECQDPVIPENQKILTLYYYFKNNLPVISTDNPANQDFKTNL